ncbi:RNA ligase RtcB family protein [Anaerosinus massiliensis]|uniref:RNA ligase RtcB family protein n=1 Tax=Massilibacillus massiliensis TaxID=1806837 RepID=UPI000ABCDB2E|nr:RNA ligase RtcB family protein [Massilibacillus massiliensis]
MSKIKIITNEKNWLEDTAINQLKCLSELPSVIQAVGLPDLHAGKSPIGAVIVTKGCIYPQIIGGDIGCGMGLFSTGIEHRKFKLERWVTKLNCIRELIDVETINPYKEPSPIYDLGTIGGGNHFAEFQVVDRVYDKESFAALSIDESMLMLLIHSGSRGYGQSILNRFDKAQGLINNSKQMQDYMAEHEQAVVWASRNRSIVANKLLRYLGYTPHIEKIIDCQHNFIEQRNDVFIHRKGAVSAELGAVVIPGSRGALTYVVKPTENTKITAYSLSHGAGRKWARSLCKSRIRDKYDRNTIRQTKLKSKVVCHDTDLLFQEAPEAYKNIDTVIESLLQFGLIEVVATLRPVLTYKG